MIVRSVLSNWAALAVSIAASVALTPLLVHGLGHFEYGLWFLASSLVDYFGLLDVGMRATLQRFVARLRAAGDRSALDETFSTGIALTLAVCLTIPVCAAGLAVWLPHLLVPEDVAGPVFVWLVVLLGLTVSVTVLARFLGAYLCGCERFDLFNLAAIISILFRTALIVVMMALGQGAVGVVVASLAGAVLMAALHGAFIRRLDPHLRLSLGRIKAQRARELVSFSVYIVLVTAGEQVWTYSAPIIIARTLGVALVTPFSIAIRLIDNFRSIVIGLIGPLMPRMSALHGEEFERDLRALTLRATGVTALLSSLIAWILVLSGDDFVRFWLGPGFEVSITLMHIILVGAVISQVYWVHAFGLVGAAMAMTVPRAIVKMTIQPWYVLRVVGTTFGEFFRVSLLRPLIVNALFLVISAATNAFAPTGHIVELVWAVSWESGVFLALAYSVGLTPASRRAVWESLRTLLWRSVAVTSVHEVARGK
jgi:O-antigen/teichoic acid export membrane protein